LERGHLELRAEGRLRERDGHLAQQVLALAPEERVLLDEHDAEHVAAGAAALARLALAGKTELLSRLDAGRDADLDLRGARLGAGAAAGGTGIGHDLAAAAAGRARRLHDEEALAALHLAAAAARGAGLG